MSLLDTLFRAGVLRPLDHALAQSLRRLELQDGGEATPDLVLAAAGLASLAVSHGHAGFDPARPQLLFDGDIAWPDAGDWTHVLARSRWVATPARLDLVAADAPLVLEGGLLYLRRYREYERRLAQRLQGIAARTPVAATNIAALASLFAALFPQARDGEDRQARAAALALLRSLLLVTGGPGTGKTTTIARLLVLLAAQAHANGSAAPRIALAAPTGRAAERMAESLRAALAALRDNPAIDPALCDALPATASTLHRLLGTIPGSPRFRFDADQRLPFDVVVVDEASMVDLPLMCKLTEAIADDARLILLGDPDQLPSVEAGDVLAAILDAAGDDAALPASLAEALVPLLGASPQGGGEPAVPAASGQQRDGNGFPPGHRVHLLRGYRQAEGFDLAPLAIALRDGDAGSVLQLLRGGTLPGIHFHEDLSDPLAAYREALLGHWRALTAMTEPVAALALATRLRLLTALRDGPQGAHGLNARIEEALAGPHRPRYFHGRLLLVTENNYRNRLFNGDIGICLRPGGNPPGGRDGNGEAVAWFAGEDGPRPFHPAALPAHDSAFAMTVHKAQGSEFDTVWLQLPRHDARTLSRELLYTAVTRARRELHVCASTQVLRDACARRATRVSGLAQRLRG